MKRECNWRSAIVVVTSKRVLQHQREELPTNSRRATGWSSANAFAAYPFAGKGISLELTCCTSSKCNLFVPHACPTPGHRPDTSPAPAFASYHPPIVAAAIQNPCLAPSSRLLCRWISWRCHRPASPHYSSCLQRLRRRHKGKTAGRAEL